MTTMTETTRESVLETIERIRPIVEAHRDEAERDRRFPDTVVRAMLDAGLGRLWAPREYGGDEIDIPTFLLAVERLSIIDSAAGWMLANNFGGVTVTAFLPPAPPSQDGSDGASGIGAGTINPRGRATPVEGGYRLSGRWPLVSGAHHAAFMSAAAIVFEGDAPRIGSGGQPDLQLMSFPAQDCTVLDTWHSLGMRGTDSTDIVVQDIFVPEHMVFSPFGSPPRVAGALYRGGLLPLFAFSHTAVHLGIARAAIDAFVDLARTKVPMLSQAPLASRPTVHAELAKAKAQLQSARAYFYEAAREFMAALEAGAPVPDDVEARRRLATTHCAAACQDVVEAMFRLGGATAIYSGHPLERCLRDIQTLGQHTFVSPTWWEKTGQYYFGLGLGMP